MLDPRLCKALMTIITFCLATLLVASTSAATFLVGRHLAVRLAGMGEVEYYHDSIVAFVAIVTHLAVEHILRHPSYATRCLWSVAAFLIRLVCRILTGR
jgi:hypothetical protein